jgi:N utilization substance protein B
MTRRELRENTFKMLFRLEFHKDGEMSEQLSLFEEELSHISDEERNYLTTKCNNIFARVGQIDEEINAASKGWKTTRMAKVDLTLIRLAVYEIRFEEDIPFKVSVNEAVELAKKYGTDDSPAFINGVLAKFA